MIEFSGDLKSFLDLSATAASVLTSPLTSPELVVAAAFPLSPLFVLDALFAAPLFVLEKSEDIVVVVVGRRFVGVTVGGCSRWILVPPGLVTAEERVAGGAVGGYAAPADAEVGTSIDVEKRDEAISYNEGLTGMSPETPYTGPELGEYPYQSNP